MLDALFKLTQNKTSVRTEILAGLTTFMTIAYIAFVNPQILSNTGMDPQAVFGATCIAAAVGCAIMGLLANWPIAMAPGMGLNAFFAFVVVGKMGYTWQEALGAVFISGIFFLILTLTGVRKWLINGIPQSLRSSIVAGLSLFLALIALKSSGLIVANPDTLVSHGDLSSAPVIFTIIGFFIITCLDTLKVKGALIIGIIIVTVLAMILGYADKPNTVISMPPSLAPTFMQLDLPGILEKGFLNVVLVYVLVELFDATGTMVGVAKKAGLLTDKDSSGLGKGLMADSVAIITGSVIGTSSTTAFVESTAGVQAGGRTGLTAITVGILFLLMLFLAPLAGVIPIYATAPALLFVATMMLRDIVEINWRDPTDAVPSAITAISMPFTYSIAEGIGFGFISYVIIKCFTGKWRDIHPATAVIAGLFLLRFIFGD